MVKLRAFKALRPREDLVEKIAALPYDTMDTHEARLMAEYNPHTYLKIDRAEIDLEETIDIHDDRVYEKAKENLDIFKDKGYLVKDEDPSIYIYRQIMDGRVQTGLVACVRIDDSINNIIKIHEHTKPDKVEDRTKHIRYCQAHTGTILLTYHEDEKINKIIEDETLKMPLYNFTTDDNISHTVWKLEKELGQKIEELFDKNVGALYIADGHHRSKSAVNYAVSMKEIDPDYNPDKEYNYYLAMIAPKNQLYVMDYNRILRDLNGLDKDEFFEAIKENFYISPQAKAYKPDKKYTFGMYIDKNWYKLELINLDQLGDGTVKNLDVSVLHDLLIEPILDIEVPQKDPRIDFIGGIRGLGEIEKKVDSGEFVVGFSLFPTGLEELMRVADEDKIMPAKSTWFEPKVRCGLFVHEF